MSEVPNERIRKPRGSLGARGQRARRIVSTSLVRPVDSPGSSAPIEDELPSAVRDARRRPGDRSAALERVRARRRGHGHLGLEQTASSACSRSRDRRSAASVNEGRCSDLSRSAWKRNSATAHHRRSPSPFDVAGVKKDASGPSSPTGSDATAATLEEMARSIKGVAWRTPRSFAASSEELLATASQMSASVVDMTTRGQANAASLEQVGATVEEMTKGIASPPRTPRTSAQRVGTLATSVVTTDTLDDAARVEASGVELATSVEETSSTVEELARSIRAVAEQARQLESTMRDTATANVTSVGRRRRRGARRERREERRERRGVDGRDRADRAIERRDRREREPDHLARRRERRVGDAARGVVPQGRADRRGRARAGRAGEQHRARGRRHGVEVDLGLLEDPRVDQRVVDRDEGNGPPRRGDRRHRRHDQPPRRSHEPALAEREHRGGARR